MQMKEYLDVLPEIQEALDHNKPVVALESTILSHGMPYPENVSFAAEVEKVVRAEGGGSRHDRAHRRTDQGRLESCGA